MGPCNINTLANAHRQVNLLVLNVSAIDAQICCQSLTVSQTAETLLDPRMLMAETVFA